MRSIIFIAALLSLAPCNIVSANEIEGIRLGMTTEQTLKAAGEKGYTFSNPMKSASNSDWTSYVLMKDGPNISFCGNVLSALTKSYDSNLRICKSG